MNDPRHADLLAQWLAEPPGTPPPSDLDEEVVEGVLALRPDLAPAARLAIEDVLASLTEGPLASPQGGEQAIGGLIDWLAAHPGAEPPEDVEAEVVEAVFALRPDLAPAPRVSIEDVLGSLGSGPLAPPSEPPAEARSSAPSAHEASAAVVSLDSRRRRRWTTGATVSLLAAAAALVVVVPMAERAPDEPLSESLSAEARRRQAPASASAAIEATSPSPSWDAEENGPPPDLAKAEQAPAAGPEPAAATGHAGLADESLPSVASEDITAAVSPSIGTLATLGFEDDLADAATPSPRDASSIGSASRGASVGVRSNAAGRTQGAPSADGAAENSAESTPRPELEEAQDAFSASETQEVTMAEAQDRRERRRSAASVLDKETTKTESADTDLASPSAARRWPSRTDLPAAAPPASEPPPPSPAAEASSLPPVAGASSKKAKEDASLDALRTRAWSLTLPSDPTADRDDYGAAVTAGTADTLQAFLADGDERVAQDAAFRIARQQADGGGYAAALATIARGLGVSNNRTVFRARLLALQGQVHERRGDPDAAMTSYRLAIETLYGR